MSGPGWVQFVDSSLSHQSQRRRVNIVKAAEIAGVTRRTIYNWMWTGKVEYEDSPDYGVFIYLDTLLRQSGKKKGY